MKKTMAAIFILMSICINTGLSCGAASPVVVTHKLTLSLPPLLPLTPRQTTLNTATLEPRQGVDFDVQVTTPVLNPDGISHNILIRTGKCVVAQRTQIEFPAVTRPGGAR